MGFDHKKQGEMMLQIPVHYLCSASEASPPKVAESVTAVKPGKATRDLDGMQGSILSTDPQKRPEVEGR